MLPAGCPFTGKMTHHVTFSRSCLIHGGSGGNRTGPAGKRNHVTGNLVAVNQVASQFGAGNRNGGTLLEGARQFSCNLSGQRCCPFACRVHLRPLQIALKAARQETQQLQQAAEDAHLGDLRILGASSPLHPVELWPCTRASRPSPSARGPKSEAELCLRAKGSLFFSHLVWLKAARAQGKTAVLSQGVYRNLLGVRAGIDAICLFVLFWGSL